MESSLKCMINSSFPVWLSYIIFRDTQKPMTLWFNMLASAVKIPTSQVTVVFKAVKHSLKKFKLRKVKKVVKHVQCFHAPDIKQVPGPLFGLQSTFSTTWLIKDLRDSLLSNIRSLRHTCVLRINWLIDFSVKLLTSAKNFWTATSYKWFFEKHYNILSFYEVSSQFYNSSRF